MSDPRPTRLFPLRTVVFGGLVPSFVFSLGVGAMLPIIAPYAVGQGASLAMAGVVAAMLPVGQIIADVPAGALAAKIGDRAAMLLAAFAAALGFLAAAAAPSPLTLGGAILLVGAANSVFQLARPSYLTEVTPLAHRARVLSTLGGAMRLGQFLGPFLGALVIHSGELRVVFLVALATAVLAGLVVAFSGVGAAKTADGGDGAGEHQGSENTAARRSLREVFVSQRRLFATLGAAVVLIGCLRGARQQVIPLWGEHIGMDPTTISLIFGIAGGIDVLMFYPAGKIMDHFGRLWLAAPAMLMLGAATAALPLTSTAGQMTLVAMLIGLGNGLGSGILMTVGADVAPADARPQFLGLWRLMQDSGLAIGPLLLSAGAALGSLAAGVLVTASMGPLASAALARWLPQFSAQASRRTRRHAGLG
ncbi:MFS transporter [Nesterenkonia aerolata]|uniref:MFS transporter n=1 Tax=Nesterenkonia aerolata TaxID=3074079 RepID=A0ABU2DRT1_9MICC|nr:MFS transporter [Nesterenkonia sp. LY-0111]MDR8019184.1 MFS transporter [Nesterenkonia sp. LY-0111]